ncbi:MAG: glucose 1-dehydrogenase [Actinobacteria bacterium]|nr:glucose 1-dehydrogenase [Actinomycetota bacterium]
MARLDGKSVLITGAARGQGAAHARRLVEEGAGVTIADLREDEGRALAEELGEAARFATLDVTDAARWASAVESAVAAFGRLDGLVNNAGMITVHSLESATVEEWDRVIAVNQTGVFHGMRAVIPEMRKAGSGSIVNIASVVAWSGAADFYSYAVSKWAVRGMTKSAALELAEPGIRVNTVAPGEIDTEMMTDMEAQGADPPDPKVVPLGRWGAAAEVSSAIVFLLSDEASYVTGAEIGVDGGLGVGPAVGPNPQLRPPRGTAPNEGMES